MTSGDLRRSRQGFEPVTASVSGTAGRWRRPALSGRMWLVNWQEAGPLVTVVVRCNPVVRGPDVAPMWPQQSRAWMAHLGTPSMPGATPMPQVRPSSDRSLLTVSDRRMASYGTRRTRPPRTKHTSAGRRRIPAWAMGGAPSRGTRASLARAAGPRQIWVRVRTPDRHARLAQMAADRSVACGSPGPSWPVESPRILGQALTD
jgi:hypothetical protein